MLLLSFSEISRMRWARLDLFVFFVCFSERSSKIGEVGSPLISVERNASRLL